MNANLSLFVRGVWWAEHVNNFTQRLEAGKESGQKVERGVLDVFPSHSLGSTQKNPTRSPPNPATGQSPVSFSERATIHSQSPLISFADTGLDTFPPPGSSEA